MPDVTTGLRECRDRVRALGYRVEEVPGWESRGKGRLYPKVAVNHHDAIRGPSPTAGLRVCTFGRPDLRNSLCATYGERGPGAGIWIVAAGVSWHAGAGGWDGVSGNANALGRENANDGVGEPYHPDALAVQLAWDRVQSEVFGIPPARYCEHHEWSSRKIDRRYHGPSWRWQIATYAHPSRPKKGRRRMVVIDPNNNHFLYSGGVLQFIAGQAIADARAEGLAFLRFSESEMHEARDNHNRVTGRVA